MLMIVIHVKIINSSIIDKQAKLTATQWFLKNPLLIYFHTDCSNIWVTS